jgi:hypothetical protein
LDRDYRLKKKLLSKKKMDFLTRAARSSRILRVKVRNDVIREDMEVTQTVLEIMEYNVLKWYGHVLCMKDNRWPERIMIWSPEGRRRPEMKWEMKCKE